MFHDSQGTIMKRTYYCAALALAATTGLAQADGFINGGFENGNTNDWTSGQGFRGHTLNSALGPSQLLPGASLYSGPATRSAIISAGTLDPRIGAALGSTVYAGHYSYRVEDTAVGGYASAISQSVSNYTEANIFFAWKAVLQNGGHVDTQSAAMFLTLRDDTTGTQLLSRFYNAGQGGGGVDGRFTQQGNIFYTSAWQIEQLAIDSSLAGHDFTLSLAAADCYPTAHTGYVYLDGFGGVAPAVPEPASYAMLLGGLGLIGCMARRLKSRA